MEFVKGLAVVPGIAIARVLVLDIQDFLTAKRFVFTHEVNDEIKRFRLAVEQVIKDLDQLRAKVDTKVGGELALIFQAHIGILQDKIFQEDVENAVREKLLTAEYATSTVMRKLEKALRAVSDEYLSQRATDVVDISRRLQQALAGSKAHKLKDLTEPVIIVARDLTPSQLAAFDHDKITGVAMDRGGLSSHTSILLRAFGIPAVIGLNTVSTDVSSNETAIVDGSCGLVILRPSDEMVRKYEAKKGEYLKRLAVLHKEGIIPAVTTDGVKISVTANIEFPEEIEHALDSGMEGIGLYRTEYLYLELDHEPNEEDHFKAYRKSVGALKGKPIVLRTLDLGADKLFSRDILVDEANPFLGFRSIRMFLTAKQDIFKLQLRAMLRASNFGPVRILFPMISSLSEIREAKLLLEEVKEELDEKKIPYDKKVPIGVMIEVPSLAISSDIAAKEVDFFSIGTNDLVQFTMAVDRTNDRVSYLYQPLEMSIIRLVKMVIDNGHKNSIPVSMCGEMSGDPVNTILLLGMGLDEFSVAPTAGPLIKHIIRHVDRRDCEAIAKKALKIGDHNELYNYLIKETRRLIPDLGMGGIFQESP